MAPAMTPTGRLAAGETGYLVTGLKSLGDLRVGDTLTRAVRPAAEPLPGYREVKPMVFCGLFPVDADDYPDLRDALEKLSLNDASLRWEPETSQALGFGFRCGFLGLLHMDIVRERLEREYDLELLATTPNVEYQVTTTGGECDGRALAGRAAAADHHRSRRSRSPTSAARSWCRRRASAPSWGSARTGAASSSRWSRSRTASRWCTTCRWPRSSSTSTTS